MAYKRRYRKRRFKRRTGYSKLWKKVNKVASVVNAEKKFLNTTSTLNPDSSTGNVIHCTAIAQGDDYNARNGRSLLLKSIYFRAQLTINASATQTFVRMLLVQDLRQVASTTPSVTAVLDNITMTSPMNIKDNPGRFKVFMDRVISVNAAAKPIAFAKKFCKLSKHVKYNNTNSGSIEANGVYLLLFSTESTNTPSLNYMVKVSYYDN